MQYPPKVKKAVLLQREKTSLMNQAAVITMNWQIISNFSLQELRTMILKDSVKSAVAEEVCLYYKDDCYYLGVYIPKTRQIIALPTPDFKTEDGKIITINKPPIVWDREGSYKSDSTQGRKLWFDELYEKLNNTILNDCGFQESSS